MELNEQKAKQQDGGTTPSDSGIDDDTDGHSSDGSDTDSDDAGNDSGARTSTDQHNKEITRLQGELDTARETIQEKDNENQRLRESDDSKEQEMIAMRNALEESTRRNVEQQRILQDGNSEIQRLQDDADNRFQELNTLSTSVESLNERWLRQQETIAEKEGRILQMHENASALRVEVESVRVELDSERVITDQLRLQFADLNTTLEDNHVEIAQLSADNETYTVDLDTVRTALIAAEAQREVAHEQRDFAQKELEDMRVVHAAQDQNTENQREQLATDLDGAQGLLRDEQARHAGTVREVGCLTAQLETTRTALIAAEAQRDVAHGERDSAQRDLLNQGVELASNLEAAQAQLRDEQERLTESIRKAASLTEQLETTRTALIAAKAQRDEAHEERDLAQTNLLDQGVELASDLEATQAQLRDEQERLAEKIREAASLTEQLETTRTKLSAANAQRDEAREERDSAQTDLLDQREELVTDLKDKQEQLRVEQKGHAVSIREVTCLTEQLETSRAALIAANEQRDTALQDLEDVKEEFSIDLENTREQLRNAQARYDESLREIERLNGQWRLSSERRPNGIGYADIVWTTNYGHRYHREGCHYVSRSGRPILYEQHMSDNFCSFCASRGDVIANVLWDYDRNEIADRD